MFDRNTLTVKQLKILRFIEQEFIKMGHVPTFRAIASHFEFKAVGTVQDYIQKLIELGFLEKEEGKQRGFKLPHQARTTLIPILGSVPAGKPIEAIEDFRGSVALVGNWRGDLFALRVTGESMKDKGIFDGDFVIVKKQGDAEDGEIVVAQIGDEATVKTLERRSGRIRLLPANSAYQPIELKPDQRSCIIGKVIAVQRIYRS